MALCLSPPPVSSSSFARKRTSSFSFNPSSPFHHHQQQTDMSPRPAKAPRLSRRSGLRRTASFLDMTDDASASHYTQQTASSAVASHVGSARDRPSPTQDRGERRKISSGECSSHRRPPLSSSSYSDPATAIINRGPTASSVKLATATSSFSAVPPPRTTSPLAPIQSTKLDRPMFPRSKPQVDLHRKAVTTRMLRTPEGQRFLHMGPRLAFSIANATRELERIVAATMDGDSDAVMADPTPGSAGLGNSWVFVPGESQDWEMISCN